MGRTEWREATQDLRRDLGTLVAPSRATSSDITWARRLDGGRRPDVEHQGERLVDGADELERDLSSLAPAASR